jgi:hypothetical protein
MTYAADTRVPIQRTKHEIQALLAKHGADRFYCAEERSEPRSVSSWARRSLRSPCPSSPAIGNPLSTISSSAGARAERLFVDQRRPWWKRIVD